MHTKFSWGLLSEYRKELMGCSIIGIVLFHWYENCAKHGVSTGMILKAFSFGSRFVDVFLVLSGIGLFYSFSHRNDINAFYKKRMIKILPTYISSVFLRSFAYRLSGVFLGMAAALIIVIVLSIIKKYIFQTLIDCVKSSWRTYVRNLHAACCIPQFVQLSGGGF